MLRNTFQMALIITGIVDVILVSFVGFRLIQYFNSYFFYWRRYRRLIPVSTDDLIALGKRVPYIKVQITTRGNRGSTLVVERGISKLMCMARERQGFYGRFLSIEVVTESEDQKRYLEAFFERGPLPVKAYVLPLDYETPKGTALKARALHYMVELRRAGVGRRNGRTVIVHFDEESVMEPGEFRKLIAYLAKTDKKLTEGPIYYPLEYTDTALICRAMEANRPIGCFECREVMESGHPLHLHGSNLVIDEDLENQLGWDIGKLGDQPFIAEDYVFGVKAYIKYGQGIFGWHGCVMLEQPPFSYSSAFKQRYRWVVGVLQGISMMKGMREFYLLPRSRRSALVRGTLYRVWAFALGMPTALLSWIYTALLVAYLITHGAFTPLLAPLIGWMALIGFFWINSVIVGAWYNISSTATLSGIEKWNEVMKVVALAPFSGLAESTAALWALIQWGIGNKRVSWTPTPKTAFADQRASA